MKLVTDFYNRKIRMSNWELTIFKLYVFCLSLAIGCYFADSIRPLSITNCYSWYCHLCVDNSNLA